MPKQFFTEDDIEDMVKSGVMTLEVNDQVILTDLAYEKANRLGLRLMRAGADNPPSAPVRPYISQKAVPSSTYTSTPPSPASSSIDGDLAGRIKKAVIAKMGNQVDPALLDVIIARVLRSTGMK